MCALPAFKQYVEDTLIERSLMNGFWAAGDYGGVRRSLQYPEERVTLDRYLIVEEHRSWSVYNWLQYFTLETPHGELTGAGFEIEHAAASLTGEVLTERSNLIGIIAKLQGDG